MIISRNIQSSFMPPEEWDYEKKIEFYSTGRVTVVRCDFFNEEKRDFYTKYMARVRGTNIKGYFGTPEEAYKHGKDFQKKNRDRVKERIDA